MEEFGQEQNIKEKAETSSTKRGQKKNTKHRRRATTGDRRDSRDAVRTGQVEQIVRVGSLTSGADGVCWTGNWGLHGLLEEGVEEVKAVWTVLHREKDKSQEPTGEDFLGDKQPEQVLQVP